MFFVFLNLIQHSKYGTRSKSTQSNSRTAYQSRVRVRGNSDSENKNKKLKNKLKYIENVKKNWVNFERGWILIVYPKYNPSSILS